MDHLALTRLKSNLSLDLAHGKRAYFDSLSDGEKTIVLEILRGLSSEDKDPYDLLWELDYEIRPPTPRDFFNDTYWTGKAGISLYPLWKDILVDALEPAKMVRELIIQGPIGSGKSTTAIWALLYKAARLLCLRNPAGFYGLMEPSRIGFAMFAPTLGVTGSTSYYHMRAYIDQVPFFQEKFPRNPDKKSIEFPKNIEIASGSRGIHALGQNIFGGLLDEADFQQQKAGTVGAAYSDVGQAYENYTAIRRRIDSRFMQEGGDVAGLLALVSSAGTEISFLEEHIKKSTTDIYTKVYSPKKWDLKPGDYSGKKFRVFVGGVVTPSRILKDTESVEPIDGTQIVEIPVEHKLAFEKDLSGAIRDIGGISISAVSNLFPDPNVLFAQPFPKRQHPFVLETLSLDHLDVDVKISDYLKREALCRVSIGRLTPLVNPGSIRFVHVDLGITGDAAALTMGHIFGTRDRSVEGLRGVRSVISDPIIYIDLIIKVTPPEGGRIRLGAFREFIIEMSNWGFKIGLATYDGFQSEDSMQILNQNGIPSTVMSVDRTDEAYVYLLGAYNEGRIDTYLYPPFLVEGPYLQRDMKRKKVDHLSGRSKDVSDTLAGVCKHCMSYYFSHGADTPPVGEKADIISRNLDLTFGPGSGQESAWAVGNEYKRD